MTETEEQAKRALLDAAIEQLSEHFDSIQIITTLLSDDKKGSHLITQGHGCLFSRIKACEFWAEGELEPGDE